MFKYMRPMGCSLPGLPVHHHLPEITQIHVHWVSDAIQPSNPLYPLLLLPSIFPSNRVFSNELVLHIRWPKYWRFSFSISHSNEYLGLTSFGMDWLDLLEVQGTLKSLLQHTTVQKHQFFGAQLSLWSNSHIQTCKLTISISKKAIVCKTLWSTCMSSKVRSLFPRENGFKP